MIDQMYFQGFFIFVSHELLNKKVWQHLFDYGKPVLYKYKYVTSITLNYADTRINLINLKQNQ